MAHPQKVGGRCLSLKKHPAAARVRTIASARITTASARTTTAAARTTTAVARSTAAAPVLINLHEKETIPGLSWRNNTTRTDRNTGIEVFIRLTSPYTSHHIFPRHTLHKCASRQNALFVFTPHSE